MVSIYPLSAAQIVKIWELGQSHHPLDRALLCLACACPDLSMVDLAELPIGQRDAALLTLRELTFGPQMDSQADCPHCQERLEFSLKVSDIRVGDFDKHGTAKPSGSHYHFQTAGLDLTFRLPNSLDLAAIATISASEARVQLTHRCLLQVEQSGQPISVDAIPVEAIAQLSHHLTEADPQAEILLDLQCPACQHAWQVCFDIAVFLWSEIQRQAQRLLQEVHLLARAYGWREADILSLSSVRRHYYLELVS